MTRCIETARIQTTFETSLLRGKRILVTGGGSGLGAAMGRRFLALGAGLVICGRKLDRLEATAREMREETGGKVTTIACDIRDGAAVDICAVPAPWICSAGSRRNGSSDAPRDPGHSRRRYR
nr:SDR family NAD(P)-dependent oxidoreductase [Bradyrhizobium japonicum]